MEVRTLLPRVTKLACLGLLALVLTAAPMPITFAQVDLPSVTYGGQQYYAGEEIIPLRQENSKTFVMSNGNIGLDVHIGAIHYKDNYADKSEQWKDIDLTWEGNRVTKAPYELTLEGNGITVRDKETGEISTLELLEVGGQHIPAQAWEKSRGLARTFDTDLEVVAENTRVRFARILKSDTASREAKYRVTGNISLRVSARDAEGELPVEWTLRDGILTENLKPDRPVKYPVRIDPTLNLDVGAGDDDCWAYWDGSIWKIDLNDPYQRVGYYNDATLKFGGGMRFTGVTIPDGETIFTAYLVLDQAYNTSGTVVNSVIVGEQSETAATFSDIANYQGRRGLIVGGPNDNNITTASVTWNGIGAFSPGGGTVNSAEIKTIIQELVDDYSGLTNADIAIFWDDHGDNSTHASGCWRGAGSYNNATYDPPRLHIEYASPEPTVTTGAATNVEETSATLNGEITVTGGGGNATVRGFDWDTDSGTPYASNWYEEGSFGTGSFNHGITSLTEGELYYFRAYAINPSGTGYGSELTFLTKPDEPTSFTATASDSQADLAWTKGTGAQKTMIRFRTDGTYPTGPADGDQAYFDTGSSYPHTGLSGGLTYLYRAWSYATEGGLTQYSDGYDSASVYIDPSLVLWYQPITMISGTTLPDRQGAAQNGTISWGSNPSGVDVSIGALLPVTQSAATTEAEAEVPGFTPTTEGVGPVATPGVEGEGFPFYGLFKDLFGQWAELGGPSISMPYFWKVVAVILGWVFGTAVMLMTRNVFFGLVAYFIGFAIPAGAMGGVLDLWVPIVYGLGAVATSLLMAKWTASSM